jgi:hypothetical protein
MRTRHQSIIGLSPNAWPDRFPAAQPAHCTRCSVIGRQRENGFARQIDADCSATKLKGDWQIAPDKRAAPIERDPPCAKCSVALRLPNSCFGGLMPSRYEPSSIDCGSLERHDTRGMERHQPVQAWQQPASRLPLLPGCFLARLRPLFVPTETGQTECHSGSISRRALSVT